MQNDWGSWSVLHEGRGRKTKERYAGQGYISYDDIATWLGSVNCVNAPMTHPIAASGT